MKIAKKLDKKIGDSMVDWGSNVEKAGFCSIGKGSKEDKKKAREFAKRMAPHLYIKTGLDSNKTGFGGIHPGGIDYNKMSNEDRRKLISDLKKYRNGENIKINKIKPIFDNDYSNFLKERTGLKKDYSLYTTSDPNEVYMMAHELGHEQNDLENTIKRKLRYKFNRGGGDRTNWLDVPELKKAIKL